MNQVYLLKFIAIAFAFVIAITKAFIIYKTDKPKTVGLFSIWFFGLMAFLLGFVDTTLNSIATFDAIAAAGDISPALVASGFSIAQQSFLTGLYLLIFSLILWASVKQLKNWKIRSIDLSK